VIAQITAITLATLVHSNRFKPATTIEWMLELVTNTKGPRGSFFMI
jgi:hypothetical protein